MVRKGDHQSKEARDRISSARMGRFTGDRNPFFRKHHTVESIEKMRKAQLGKIPWNKGKTQPQTAGDKNPAKRPDVRMKICAAIKGKPHPWQVGERNPTKRPEVRKLHVHHVNYRKDACCEEEVARQFIPLCNSCHSRTNHDRVKWEKVFSQVIEKKFGGRCYFYPGEQLIAYGMGVS